MFYIHFTTFSHSFGHILLAKTEKGLCALFLGDDDVSLKQALLARFPKANLVEDSIALQALQTHVLRLFNSPQTTADFPLDLMGTAFQQRVWQALRTIPVGTTTNYSDIAHTLNMPLSTRAIANACGANPVAVIIPCHRVLKKDGSLSGYRWGVARKRALLQHENAL